MTGFFHQTLTGLLENSQIKVLKQHHLPVTPVTGIVFDSRQVQPGYLFVALKGDTFDGHRFISQAIDKGATAVLGELDLDPEFPYIQVENSREALAYLAAAFYNYPASSLTVIGVTGTDGKTTTSNLIFQILMEARIRAGIISTVNAVIGDEVVDTGFHVTTPEAPEIQHILSRMVAAGLTHTILEATSHGLAQYRVAGCEFDIGVVTNITHEHLDYHGSFEAYRAAKGKLFSSLALTKPKTTGNPRLAVLNRDDPSYSYLKELAPGSSISYGFNPEADVRAEAVEFTPQGIDFIAAGPEYHQRIHSRLVGAFNVSNCLAAITAATSGLGISAEIAAEGIANFMGVPGRMERIDLGQDFTAIVDFAHTPNALLQALLTTRQISSGRIIVVFGSAGLRDREKRRMMAETAVKIADMSIFTAEDPRTESLADILEEMAVGAQFAGGIEGSRFIRIPDRREAILAAVKMAHPGDVVITCGKGHEQSMCFGTVEYPWDDRTAVEAALAGLLQLTGYSMPFLPGCS